MDNFTYNYKSTNNQLLSVSDAVNNNAAKKLGDIQPGQSAENYKYDGIGNLIEDKQEEIKNIAWQANGKVKSVTRTPLSTKPDLEFKYDALGQRVAKIVKPKNDNGELLPESEWETTWYVRDAQGNEMGIYKQKYTPVGTNIFEEELKIEEFSIYGSSRLGTASPKDNLLSTRRFSGAIDNQTKRFSTTQTQSLTQLSFNPNIVAHYRGTKQYHLSNHLGNVLATVSDRIIPESMDGLTVSSFKAEVVSASDYYPFGMHKQHRKYKINNIDFGFNGMRKENEWTEGNYDFGARIYDSRSGRWFAVDPLFGKYVDLSTYNFVANMPITAVDPNGESVQMATRGSYDDMISHWNTLFSVPNQKGVDAKMTEVFKKAYMSYGSGGNSHGIFHKHGITNIKQFEKEFKKTLRGMTNDQKALAKGYYMAIMSDQLISFLSYRGENLDRVFGSDVLESKYGKSLKRTLENHGGGFSVTDAQNGQSRELVVVSGNVSDYQSILLTKGKEERGEGTLIADKDEAIAHELVGHALSHLGKESEMTNNTNAIRVSNIVRRIKHLELRNGNDHQEPIDKTKNSLEKVPKMLE